MKETTADNIKNKAQELQSEGKKWHFHILTPECQLNNRNQYALILENIDDNQSWICFSEKPYMNIGKQLVKILHGNDVIKDKSEKSLINPSKQVVKLLKRAKQMKEENKFWHHYMLFPKCMFNQHGNKFVIVFEDQEKNETIEILSDVEPKSDLQHIEALFYSQ